MPDGDKSQYEAAFRRMRAPISKRASVSRRTYRTKFTRHKIRRKAGQKAVLIAIERHCRRTKLTNQAYLLREVYRHNP